MEVRIRLLETDVDNIFDAVRSVTTELEQMERTATDRSEKVMNRINYILVAFLTTAVMLLANIIYEAVSTGVTP